MKVTVFTDGGCLYNGKANAKASWAYYFPDHPSLSEAGRVPTDQPQTNNRGELLGILNSIEKVIASFDAAETDIHIYTDSEYSKNCLTKWIPGWIKKGWITASGTPVLNKDLIESISGRLLMFQSYCINHVRAHTGGEDELSRNNHIVDRMAAGALDDTPAPAPPTPTQKTKEIEGCPLQLMGPPLTEETLVKWCREHFDQLDESALNAALLSALSKTVRRNGCELVKRRLRRVTQYRLAPLSGILTDIHKDE